MRTVSELIEGLQKLPQDALIGVASVNSRMEGKLFPVKFYQEYIVSREDNYCMDEDDFHLRIGSGSEFVETPGYWLAPDYDDIPQKYFLIDDYGEIIKAEEE